MANIIDVKTDNDLQYQYFPVSSDAIRFEVETPNDAHLALTMGPQESNPMYEVFIGGWNNTKSVIRRNKIKPDKVTVDTPDIVSSHEFRGFWIRWDGGVVSAGREGEAIPFIAWTDPDPFAIAYVGVCTGWGATGTWKIEVSPIILREIDYKVLDGANLRWERVHNQILPLDAIVGGFENEPLFIARAEHNHSLTPGKYVRSQGMAFLPWGGREHPKTEFEVLCGYDYQWVKSSGHSIPENAFVAGYSENRHEPVYVGRWKFDGFLITGKVHALYGTCYLPYQGKEIEVGCYEILVKPSVITRGCFSDSS
ncbi:hypothetical protein K1T71_002066 [Dendrolimus kikuchii]|uniref:Uncharacterized protein n=1 Tax=Dendrolimus kikuchii TaxID=765133 RepID=A0ACC1DGF7_9NEOP|nr:hypothetical protein K1T71_002066 [Dendrolimus kikuchii]